MTREELDQKLESHKKWLVGSPDGVCADLGGSDLHGADLHGAGLSRVDLHGADLSGADLSGADLYRADLHDADLRDADLRGADIRSADLGGADLRDADLDYSCWPLWFGSLEVKIDKRIACQLLYHTLRAMQSVNDPEVRAVCNDTRNIALANQSHLVEEEGRLEPKA